MSLHVVILAAGKGTRMRSKLPKVLHPLAGKPMLAHVLEQALMLNPVKISIVVGFGAQKVKAAFSAVENKVGVEIIWIEQKEQLGTGHAVKQALPNVKDNEQVLILYGDVPLIKADTLHQLLNTQIPKNAKNPIFALLTVNLENPFGYGRILREAGEVVGIVEQKDASSEQQLIEEVNTGIMVISAEILQEGLPQLKNNNIQEEYYLTDMVAFAVSRSVPIVTSQPHDIYEVEGINDKIQLSNLERRFQYDHAVALMGSGVTIIDPKRIDIRGNLQVGNDVTIDANVIFEGEVTLGDGVSIGPNCVIQDSTIENGCQIYSHTVIEGSHIGEACNIGPYARLRPGTKLIGEVKIGNFVETKKVLVGRQSKINHLSYVGDAKLGDSVNVGAGTITCNYDGINKHLTTIEDGAFIGSNSALVAPVTVGKEATIGAGTTLTKDAPSERLTLSRAQQKTSENWRRPVKGE